MMTTSINKEVSHDKHVIILLLILIILYLVWDLQTHKKEAKIIPLPIPTVEPVVEPVIIDDIKWIEYCDVVKTGTKISTKPIWFYFSSKSCPPCKILHDTTFLNDDVKEISKRFTCVKFDTHESARMFGVSSYPRSMFGYVADGQIYIKRLRDVRDFQPSTVPRNLVLQLQEGLND